VEKKTQKRKKRKENGHQKVFLWVQMNPN
jgi:hypothetical protein